MNEVQNKDMIRHEASSAEGSTLYALKQSVFIMFFACALCISRGTVAWVEAWLYLGAMVLISFANTCVMDPLLLAERSRIQTGTKWWDVFLSIFTALLGPLVVLVVAGLDRRFCWSEPSGALSITLAMLMLLLGAGIATWAMHVNRFFSATVRIQGDRDHQVIDTGPYRFIRHPGYLGGIIGNLATPLILGSAIGFRVSIGVAGGIILRTALEDRILRKELADYEMYAHRVHYRLLPPLW